MAANKHIAVIDIGKTNAKVALVVAPAMLETDVRTIDNSVVAGPSYPHYDTEKLQRFILRSLQEFNRQRHLDGISVTAHGATIALIGADGELALPVMDYEFDGIDTCRAEYDEMRAPFSQTGSPAVPGGLNAGAQLYWLQQNHPEQFAAVRDIVTYPQFWSGWLSGVFANEVSSLGCHTDLWNPNARCFASTVDGLNVRAIMSPIRKAGDILGNVRPELAKQMGLIADVPVYCGIHDSNASLLPHLLTRVGAFNVISTGTWVICMGIGSTVENLDPARDALVNVDAFGNAVPSARFMGGREYALLMGEMPPDWTLKDLDTVLDERKMVLPQVVPAVGPFPNHRSGWQSVLAGMGGGQRHVCASLYLALVTAECLKMTGLEGPIIVEGPFSKNTIFLMMLTALAERAILVNSNTQTGTTLGAALLAGSVALSDFVETFPEPAWQTGALMGKLRNYGQSWNRNVTAS
jgi:sugar (pentulose or hexulose) kinase